jgi:hypothetical protein
MNRASGQLAEATEFFGTVMGAALGTPAQVVGTAMAHQGEHLAALKWAVG